MRAPTCRWLIAAALIGALALDAHAGQVFVDVGSIFDRFSPSNVATLQEGDIVVWRWGASGHTVTSGNRVNGAPSGAFDSSPTGTLYGPGTYFSWKTSSLPVPNPVGYFCRAHRSSGMYGTVGFPVSVTQEADFRITEVRCDGAGLNFVEIANLGDAQGDLIGFRLSINGAAAITPWTTSTPVGAFGERVVVNNPAGLGRSGSVALYAPNNIANAHPSPALTDTLMIDYVEWGTVGGQPLEATAEQTASPKVWTAGDFAEQVADGHAIAFCGVRHQYGVAFWSAVVNPTPGLPNDCSNPAIPTTWGRLKMLYR